MKKKFKGISLLLCTLLIGNFLNFSTILENENTPINNKSVSTRSHQGPPDPS